VGQEEHKQGGRGPPLAIAIAAESCHHHPLTRTTAHHGMVSPPDQQQLAS
jgi:hypothetical protein